MRANTPLYISTVWNSGYSDTISFYRKEMYKAIEDNKKLISNGIATATRLSKVGKDSSIYWKELEHYDLLIDYFLLMREEFSFYGYACNSNEYNSLLSTYNLDCIRNTFLCMYGNTGNKDYNKNNLIETLIPLLDLCCTAGTGISIMNLNNPSCNTFAIYPII